MEIKVDINKIVQNLSSAEFTAGQLMTELEYQKKETRRVRANCRALRKVHEAQTAELKRAKADAELYFDLYRRTKDELAAAEDKLAAAKEVAVNEQ